jgi:hypothetical protein
VDNIILNVLSPKLMIESDDTKESFCKQLKLVLYQLPKKHMHILLRDFSVKIVAEDILKMTTGTEGYMKLIRIME